MMTAMKVASPSRRSRMNGLVIERLMMSSKTNRIRFKN